MAGDGMKRLALANLPTPIQQPARLCESLGIDLWVKRDDATGGPEAGNKIRKLEYLLADALAQGCDTVITCGGIQSNHARATATLAASLGLKAVLLLREASVDSDGEGVGIAATAERVPLVGNLLLDLMLGADVRLISPASYQRRGEVMRTAADRLRAAGAKPYVIPEGGSNGLGALGYVEAMAEVRRQLDDGLAGGQPFDLIVHACGSGGTAAGVALGASQYGVAAAVRAMAVCNDAAYFERTIGTIIEECRSLAPELGAPANWSVDASAKGPAYAVSTPPQRARMIEAARQSGLLFDPVYTGKAFFGLWEQCESGSLAGKRVLFIHTGGLPGLLAEASTMSAHL
ncbi:MAG: D-cysteine desulfhydrase family protein [Deltaproteobacteria bacterium]|nr:D-cysteine desulfhydrase family protein [Deltaproteobacteria bacterium]